MKGSKYSALRNTYIVINPTDLNKNFSQAEIKQLCKTAKIDGVLFGPLPSKNSDFAVRIFNSDGSEAEKSGNGLRIFSRYLHDQSLVSEKKFTIETRGGQVFSQILSKGNKIRIEMGKASFWSHEIPISGKKREVLQEKLNIDDKTFTFSALTIGNPHCIIILSKVSGKLAKQYGPRIERNLIFPNRTNVQFVKILDKSNIEMYVWERGAGYTMSSGSGSCAAAVVAYKLKLCNSKVKVHMPGGNLQVEIRPDFSIIMTGPVIKIS